MFILKSEFPSFQEKKKVELFRVLWVFFKLKILSFKIVNSQVPYYRGHWHLNESL